nr:luciferase-like monooxygenase [Amycolatopsis sp.]
MRISVLDQSFVAEGGSPAESLRNSVDLARAADELGYTRYWLAEHHASAPFAGPAPEVMVATVAAMTTRIRVGSGGVLLPHYSALKVAEIFRVLEALHPGRIDLGVGRAPGGVESRALRPDLDLLGPEDFVVQLGELGAFLGHAEFPAGHPYRSLRVMPEVPSTPPVWLLGTSLNSATLAAGLGLPYVFGHFATPGATRAAIEVYREQFRPGPATPRPQVIAGVGVYCAETAKQAQYLFASQHLFRLRMTQNLLAPVPPPGPALESLRGVPEDRDITPDPARTVHEWPRYFVGDPDQVVKQLDGMAAELGIDEFMVLTTIHDHASRKRSYELLAGAVGAAA